MAAKSATVDAIAMMMIIFLLSGFFLQTLRGLPHKLLFPAWPKWKIFLVKTFNNLKKNKPKSFNLNRNRNRSLYFNFVISEIKCVFFIYTKKH